MWSVLADYFVTVGCSDNLSVAMYAMDSLRQLAMKFLDRDELANFNFQNEFMKPFVIVMRKSSSVEIRELIIRCVSQMVFARVGNVKSGWKIMFMVRFPVFLFFLIVLFFSRMLTDSDLFTKHALGICFGENFRYRYLLLSNCRLEFTLFF